MCRSCEKAWWAALQSLHAKQSNLTQIFRNPSPSIYVLVDLSYADVTSKCTRVITRLTRRLCVVQM